jgi:hypothetical protein
MSDAPINDILLLLDRYDKQGLQILRSQHPRQSEALKLGIALGPREMDAEEFTVRVAAAKRALAQAEDIAERAIAYAQKSLVRSEKWRFAGQAFTTVGGASIFTVLAADAQLWAKIAAGCAGLFGSLCTIYGAHLAKSVLPGGGQLSDSYGKLVSFRARANEMRQSLEVMERISSARREAAALITKTNTLAREILEFAPRVLAT